MTAVYENSFDQGSAHWLAARLGIPTASEFSRIVTPTGKPSSQAERYIHDLVGEYFSGEVDTDLSNIPAIERGKALEPEAFSFYAFHRDIDPQKVALVYRDETRMIACSPDGLIGDNGGLELKCPEKLGKHLFWLSQNKVPREHIPQVQSSMWVTGRDWWDFMSYYPAQPPLVVRVEPDEMWHAALDEIMPKFVAELLEARERLAEMGVVRQEPELMEDDNETE